MRGLWDGGRCHREHPALAAHGADLWAPSAWLPTPKHCFLQGSQKRLCFDWQSCLQTPLPNTETKTLQGVQTGEEKQF